MAEPPATPPAWLPDWRNAALYPNEMSDSEWRWQFLRRHPKYQAAWAMPFDDHYRRYVFETAFFGGVLPMSRSEAIQAAGSGQFWEVIALDKITERFAVNFLVDPAINRLHPALDAYFWRKFEPYRWCSLPTHEQWERQYEKGKRSLVFDLNYPLGLQLDHAKHMLETEQARRGLKEPSTRAHRSLFPLYLRLLDARAAVPRPSWSEIGSHPGMFDVEGDHAKTAEQKHSAAEVHLNKHFR